MGDGGAAAEAEHALVVEGALGTEAEAEVDHLQAIYVLGGDRGSRGVDDLKEKVGFSKVVVAVLDLEYHVFNALEAVPVGQGLSELGGRHSEVLGEGGRVSY